MRERRSENNRKTGQSRGANDQRSGRPTRSGVSRSGTGRSGTGRSGTGRSSFDNKRTTSSTPEKQRNEPKYDASSSQELFKDGEIRLNKYISNSGLCSRRDADELIRLGKVAVNNVIVTELGKRVLKTDKVHVKGKPIMPERKVYVLLNKPKDILCTVNDPEGRRTVIDLTSNCCEERIYPVGRLDRNTTGTLLLTNDGELATKLTHPKFQQRKIYNAWLDKPLTKADMVRIVEGLDLEDGHIAPDGISYVGDSKQQIGLEIHSGRNRIVRRMFEFLGYEVEKLDRVYFAGLTKKGLNRGKWRYLRPSEIQRLKMNNFS